MTGHMTGHFTVVSIIFLSPPFCDSSVLAGAAPLFKW